MDRIRYINILLALFAAVVSVSCSQESDESAVLSKTGKFSIVASISGSSTVMTRAKLLSEVPDGGTSKGINKDDYWSYWQFSLDDADGDKKADRVGFFSADGNPNGGGFDNSSMTYEEKKYGDEKTGYTTYGIFTADADVDLLSLSADRTYFYFPYDENVNTTGMELRRKDNRKEYASDPLKCVDFLKMDGGYTDEIGTNGQMVGTFYHAFSELIIMRGEGFDKAKDKTIKVYLKEPYTHLQITSTGSGSSWKCTPQLVNKNSSVTNTTEDYRVWEAWKGYNYGTTVDGNGNLTDEGVEAWYVILPTVGTGNERSEIDYIELYDNEGILQRVSSVQISDAPNPSAKPTKFSKRLTPTWRFPLEISMQELVPTVTPFPIVPWGDEQTITGELAHGITTLEEFKTWLDVYQKYLNAGRKDDDISEGTTTYKDKLLTYGDIVIDDAGKNYWHFYLRTDLDLSSNPDAFTTINKLEDVLDGQSYTLVNQVFQKHTITSLNKPFVNELAGQHAMVQNIIFQEPEIKTANAETDPIGVVAKSIKEGGTVDECNVIKGNIITNGKVGMVAGTIDGQSKISNCNLSGFLFGSATANKIVGETTDGATFENNSATSVIFNDNN